MKHLCCGALKNRVFSLFQLAFLMCMEAYGPVAIQSINYSITMKCYISLFLPCMMLTSSVVLAAQSNNTSIVHLVAFVPYLTGGNQIKPDHFGYKAAIQMAVDIINNRTDILENYKIKVHFGETYKMLTFNPANRISAQEALDHPYFNGSDSSASQDSGIVMLQEEVTNTVQANGSANEPPSRAETSSNSGFSASNTFSTKTDDVEEINGMREGIGTSVKRKRPCDDVDEEDNVIDELDYFDDDDDDDVDVYDDDDDDDGEDSIDEYYDGDDDNDGEETEPSVLSGT